MSVAEEIISIRAGARARRVAEKLVLGLAQRGVTATLRAGAMGYDVHVMGHGAAAEFGRIDRVANPVVRTVIEDVRAGDRS